MNLNLLWDKMVEEFGVEGNTVTPSREIEVKGKGIIKSIEKENGKYIIHYRKNDNAKFYGRFNKGVVTINLPYVALLAKKDMEKFWYILDQKLDLCHRALRLRHEHLVGVTSDVAPLLLDSSPERRLTNSFIMAIPHCPLVTLVSGKPYTPW